MAKTYGEFILECQNYQYSKECYELTKECYELDLMSKYLESQQFIAENMDDIREEFQEFDESFFVESVDDNRIEMMIESSKNKSKNIFGKIWKGIKNIWKKICGFFSKLFGKSKNTTKFNENLLNLIEDIPDEVLLAGLGVAAVGGTMAAKSMVDKNNKSKSEDNKSDANKKADTNADTTPKADNGIIKNILEESWKKEYQNDGFVIADNQPFANKINNRILRSKKHKHALNMLAAALSTDEIIIRTLGPKKIMSLDELIHVFEYVCLLNNEYTDKDITDIKSYIKKAMSAAMHKGIIIKVGEEDLDKTKAKLDEINTKISEFMAESVDIEMFTEKKGSARQAKKIAKMAAEGKDTPQVRTYNAQQAAKQNQIDKQNNIAKGITGINEIYSDIMTISGNVMKLYNNVENYRATVSTSLDKYLKSVKPIKMVN